MGKGLATVLLYLTVANLFHRYELEWFETSGKDVDMVHEMFAPFTAADGKGLRAYIRQMNIVQ